MARFADALDRNMEDIKRPPPLPIGNYRFRVTKMPEPPREIEGKPYEILSIPVAVVEALDDVDPDELREFGAVANTGTRLDFIFNTDPEEAAKFEGTLNRLKEFIERCGVSAEGSLKEALSHIVNAQFIGEIGHRPDPNDDSVIYHEIRRTSAL